jgi:NAD(P)-dependent dehydrogenase (short-subunit alcohol dehydrogenase family)
MPKQTAIVTGAGTGVGRAAALALRGGGKMRSKPPRQ